MIDPIELARNVKAVSEREWTDVTDGLLHITCGECGQTHTLEVKETGPGMQRVRIAREADVTDACREYGNYPLYQEVIMLREENINLKRQVEENGKRTG